ncbi:MAG: hypothetical protein AB1805_09065 [Nitrospirota bacterium]
MENKRTGNIDSEELWKDFRSSQPLEKNLTCWVCREMLKIELMELSCPATGTVDVIRIDFCPKCGKRLR